MPFLDHLEELRWKIIRSLIAIVVGTIIGLIFAKPILDLLIWPTTKVQHPLNLQVLKVQGMFMVTLEVGFFSGLLIVLPYILYEVWSFVAPGLFQSEKKYIPRVIFSATFLFFLGVFFAYYVLLPFAINFFVGLAPASIKANIAIDFYIGFVIRIMFLFGVVFELPMMSYFLSKMGFLTPHFMRKYRRHAIVIIFLVAAILTPPDPFTQMLLGIPLVLLYEFSIVISSVVHRRKKKAAEEAASADI